MHFHLYPTVLFVERSMAREVRCRVTDRQKTDTHDNYRNSRCARTSRVNNYSLKVHVCQCAVAVQMLDIRHMCIIVVQVYVISY